MGYISQSDYCCFFWFHSPLFVCAEDESAPNGKDKGTEEKDPKPEDVVREMMVAAIRSVKGDKQQIAYDATFPDLLKNNPRYSSIPFFYQLLILLFTHTSVLP